MDIPSDMSILESWGAWRSCCPLIISFSLLAKAMIVTMTEVAMCLANVSNLVRPLVNLPACAPTISHTHTSTLSKHLILKDREEKGDNEKLHQCYQWTFEIRLVGCGSEYWFMQIAFPNLTFSAFWDWFLRLLCDTCALCSTCLWAECRHPLTCYSSKTTALFSTSS